MHALPIGHILALHVHFNFLLHKLCRKLSLRQPVVATASVYFKRFYTKNAFAETDPWIVLIACVYVAAKVEETPIHVKSVWSEARSAMTGYTPRNLPADHSHLAEMEFYLLSELDFDMIVYHPYKMLSHVCGRVPLDDGTWSDDEDEGLDDDTNDQDATEHHDFMAEQTDPETIRLIQRMKKRRNQRERRRPGEDQEAWASRVWGRGTGQDSWQFDDGVYQMAW